MIYQASDLDSWNNAIGYAHRGDTILVTKSIDLGTGPYHLNEGVSLAGLPLPQMQVPTLNFDGALNLKDSVCCINLQPGPTPVIISGIGIVVAMKPGVLCGPIGYAKAQYAIGAGVISFRNVHILAPSDALYFANCGVRVRVDACFLASNFDILYLGSDALVNIVDSVLQWNPDPVGTGNACVSWGFVGNQSRLSIDRSRLNFRRISGPPGGPQGLTHLSSGPVALRNCRISNPDDLPIVNIVGIPGMRTGPFIIQNDA